MYIFEVMIKSITNFLIIFFIYFCSLNLKYLKLTKMDINRFAMKLFIYFKLHVDVSTSAFTLGDPGLFHDMICTFDKKKLF